MYLITCIKMLCLSNTQVVYTDIPENSYTAAQTEWADGSRSDVIYASRNKSKSMPLIIIELQYQVDQMFMLRLIKYSSNVYHRFKILPIVLVIVSQSFSRIAFKREFTPSADGLFLEANCKF
jgi:hypothetical protein